jgi:hypothetical protein
LGWSGRFGEEAGGGGRAGRHWVSLPELVGLRTEGGGELAPDAHLFAGSGSIGVYFDF